MKRIITIVTSAILLSSCATQKNVSLNESYWQQKTKHKVAVVRTKKPEPHLAEIGSQGLLEHAISAAMNAKLNAEIKKTDLTWYDDMPNQLAAKLKNNKIETVIAEGEIMDDQRIVLRTAARYNADDILVMNLVAAGAVREYNSVIPSGGPEAYCALKGELIDATTKEVKWRHLAEIRIPVQGQWDQPPAYPNVTNSVKNAINLCKQEVMDSLFSGRQA